MSAHLIHAPTARCDDSVGKDSSKLLQLTAKGVAIVEEFCNQFEIDHPYHTTLFKSSLNTMKLLHLPRDPLQDTIVFSDTLCRVVWNKMLGKQPVVWSEKLPVDTSPYFHQYLMHPSGNALSQYYNSKGAHMFNCVEFEAEELTFEVDYVMSGRGMWQWIMDCTNVRSSSEAQKMVTMFVDKGFVRRIEATLCSNITCADNFPPIISRGTMYRIGCHGRDMCTWSDRVEMETRSILDQWAMGEVSDDSSNTLELGSILDDPGLLVLFQETVARNSAGESLRFLLELLKIKAQYSACGPDSADDGAQRPMLAFWQALNNIVWRYIAVDSCLEINIPDENRADIVGLMSFDARTAHREMEGHISRVLERMVPIERHIRDLLASFVPAFLREPRNTQLSDLHLQREGPIIQAVF